MPVTARLSRRFYDQFGDEIAQDLVDWFNQVDLAYHNDLRELNEANFARFEARLDQRLAELRGDVRGDLRDLRAEMRELDAAMDTRWERRLGDLRAELVKWMFVFWAGTTVTVLGAVFAIVRL